MPAPIYEMLASPEIGVASTKAFTRQLMVLTAGKVHGELCDADECDSSVTQGLTSA
jgi:glucosamine 6-phosphate synthetase-like amidotransferase/phosphosugar isomerase protein